MTATPGSPSTSLPETLTSEDRWRRWEQRGFENERRFKNRVRRVIIPALTAAAVVIFLGWIGAW